MINYKKIAEHLRGLADYTLNPFDKKLGVCFEIQHVFRVSINRFADITTWSKFSGDGAYPIDHAQLSPSSAFDNTYDLWDTETQYGRDRREFCGWLADQLEQQLDDE